MSSWETRRCNTVMYSWWKKDLKMETIGDPSSWLRRFIWHWQGGGNACFLFNTLERKPQAVWGALISALKHTCGLLPWRSTTGSFLGLPALHFQLPTGRDKWNRLFFSFVTVEKWTIGKEYRRREKTVKWLVSNMFSLLKQLPSNLLAFLMHIFSWRGLIVRRYSCEAEIKEKWCSRINSFWAK